ncbi:oxygen-independent coproporphyrinogen III oxidase [Candidatus Poribacteria bacterium]|nr:oxygen-independent coproporphyrinogen III oxidase [Candidatus Poribacteria bacterium]
MTAATLDSLGITPGKIQEYDQRIPRYTSYPTAPYWKTDFGPEQWIAHLDETSAGSRDLSLYVHIPFCGKRCLFCGCNVIVTRKDWLADDYLALVEKELEIVAPHYHGSGRAIQLHLGGGTPNFLVAPQMKRLLRMLEDRFPFNPDAERSIEADPRLAKPEDIELWYHDFGFRRISFGVQDFHEETQQAIGRGQTLDVTFRNVEAARRTGFQSVNIDLIYGLPMQTAESWNSTLDAISRLRPDRIALYNFAYLPSLLPHQKGMDPSALPTPAVKLEMFIEAHNRLTREGWEFIGMDHYSLKEDSLTRAQQAGTLRRNFMGYTTLRGTDMMAFGVSSISDYQNAFVQNVKKLSEYRRMIEAGTAPVERGLLLSDDDRVRRFLIEEIMCNGVLHFDADTGVDGVDLGALALEERERLEPLEEDGLIEVGEDALHVTPKGRVFLRNIAVVFDAYLKKASAGKPMFSRAV